VELIDGEIIDVAPMGHRHAAVVDYLAKLLLDGVAERAIVRQQLPVRLGRDSEPLPDVAVVDPRDGRYFDGHPTVADIVLVVEVSSTTLEFDRRVKLPMYARHGVVEVWIVDVRGEQVHTYGAPKDGAFTTAATVPLATRMPLATLGVEIDLSPLATRLAAARER
jgi:Uma2 family endonuclease